MATTIFSLEDRLHRLVKQALDSGTCNSTDEAERLFRKYRVHIEITPRDAELPEHQAALLTTVALARRVCLGGVTVDEVGSAKLALPLPLGQSLCNAVNKLGGSVGVPDAATPSITIGDKPKARCDGFHIRTTYAGWRGGIVPAHADLQAQGMKAIPLASSLAAALAVNEAYLYMSEGPPACGRQVIGLSLWNPSATEDWLTATKEPELAYLPSKLWLIGLGHLGQAYLWTLGLLPYPDASKLKLVLQDKDIITPSTESTSVLSDHANLGLMKTRAMAAWAELRGFETCIHERTFDASFRRQESEPAVALCGIDNAVGRAALDQVGFEFVVEAGLGRGHLDFRTIRLHTLPSTRKASDIWQRRMSSDTDNTAGEAYQRLLREGTLDQCGVTQLAGKAVGAPFVGMTAAALALSQVLRLLHGGNVYHLIDLDLQAIEHRTVTPHPCDFQNLNPGFVALHSN